MQVRRSRSSLTDIGRWARRTRGTTHAKQHGNSEKSGKGRSQGHRHTVGTGGYGSGGGLPAATEHRRTDARHRPAGSMGGWFRGAAARRVRRERIQAGGLNSGDNGTRAGSGRYSLSLSLSLSLHDSCHNSCSCHHEGFLLASKLLQIYSKMGKCQVKNDCFYVNITRIPDISVL